MRIKFTGTRKRATLGLARREGGREGGRKGGREGGREKGREGGRKGEREGGKEGGRSAIQPSFFIVPFFSFSFRL